VLAVSPLFAKVHVWTFDHVATVIGIVVGAMAAWFAFLAWRSSNRTGDQAVQQRSVDVRPWPHIDDPLRYSPSGGEWSLSLSNSGGSVVDGRVVFQNGQELYGARFTTGDHVVDQAVRLRSEFAARSSYVQLRVLIAKDRDGRWWDCVNEEQLYVTWQSTLDPESIAWVNRQVADA
jgi:hypothetical protein